MTDFDMMLNCSRITLIAPGCFSALAHVHEPERRLELAESLPELNDSRVISTAGRSYEQALAVALDQPIPDLGALPIAQHRFLFDTDKKAPPHCVCAELIHLQADTDNARLLPMRALDVSDEESDQLIDALNDLIRQDGLEVMRTAPYSYYLTGMSASELDTWPAHAVANRKIADHLPRKTEAGNWRRLMTEVQMLFHAHPVNIARANAKQLPINGMWFWGGAEVSIYSPTESVELYTTDPYACGLAKALTILPSRPDDIDWSNLQKDVIVVDLGVYEAWLRGDPAALKNAKHVLQSQWITPAQNAVANGSCNEFILDGCEGQAIVEKPITAPEPLFWKRFSIRQWFKRDKGCAPETNDRTNNSDTSV